MPYRAALSFVLKDYVLTYLGVSSALLFAQRAAAETGQVTPNFLVSVGSLALAAAPLIREWRLDREGRRKHDAELAVLKASLAKLTAENERLAQAIVADRKAIVANREQIRELAAGPGPGSGSGLYPAPPPPSDD